MKQELFKKQFKFLLPVALAFIPMMASAQVEINEVNFPDENFRNYLLEQDYGADGVLTEEEIKNVERLVVSEKNISSLKGIEYFTALTALLCHENRIYSLDVSRNVSLVTLFCHENQLTSLNLPKSTTLSWLNCGSNLLDSLDVSENTKLSRLDCYNNQLTTLDVSKNAALEELNCITNQLTSLDISENTKLTRLWCYENQLTSLSISRNNTELTTLYCYANALQGESMTSLVNRLPENTRTWQPSLRVISGGSKEKNVCTTEHVAIATTKGWSVEYAWGEKYEGSTPTNIQQSMIEGIDTDTPIYALSGQQMNNLHGKKGIYLVNDKKVLVK